MLKKLFGAIGAAAILASAWYLLPATETAVPSADAAAVDYFLKIDGIDGESTDESHSGEIDISSFSWGVSQTGRASGGGGGAGKASFSNISFTTMASKASPKLMEAVATGQHIKQAKLVARKAGSDGRGGEFYTVTLSDLLVSSYQSGGSSGAVPTDQFSLNFSKIEFEYVPSTGAPVKTGYDLKLNKKI